MSLIPAAISALSSLAGGFLSSSNVDSANDAAARQAAAARKDQMQMARRNIQLQKQFAKEGVRWKVADAEAAGIHPLYALGAQTTSFSPVSVGSSTYSPQADTGLPNALANAGQDVSRAINATRTQTERDSAYETSARALTLQKMGLENELLASQVAKLNAAPNPPMPEGLIPENANTERDPLHAAGFKWLTDPNTTSAQYWNNRYGDEFPGNIPGMVVNMMSDLWRNSLLGRYKYSQWPFNR